MPLVIVSLVAGFVIGGALGWFVAKQGLDFQRTNSSAVIKSGEVDNENNDERERQAFLDQQVDKNLSYFQEHYVGYGGHYARIPLKFCRADYDFYAECGFNLPYKEVDLRKIPLPADKILSAATDVNNYIVYAVDSGNKLPDGCRFPDLFVYDLKGKTVKKLKNDSAMWTCGAISSYIEEMSPGGRYIRIVATGPTSAGGYWLYDIEKDALDTQTAQSQFVAFFSGEESNRDNYVVYQAGCEKEELITMDTSCKSILTLRDNRSGKTVVLKSVEDALWKKEIYPTLFSEMRYSGANGGELYFGTGDIGRELTIKNFNSYIKELK